MCDRSFASKSGFKWRGPSVRSRCWMDFWFFLFLIQDVMRLANSFDRRVYAQHNRFVVLPYDVAQAILHSCACCTPENCNQSDCNDVQSEPPVSDCKSIHLWWVMSLIQEPHFRFFAPREHHDAIPCPIQREQIRVNALVYTTQPACTHITFEQMFFWNLNLTSMIY